MTDINERRGQRFRLLRAVYEATEGDEHAIVNGWELGEQLGMSRPDVNLAVQYLAGENLLTHRAMGMHVGITHYGVTEVEAALLKPEEATTYFPPVVNILNIGQVTNSQIQQGTTNSQQTQAIQAGDLREIEALLDRLVGAMPEFKLSSDEREQMTSDVASARAQLAAPRPSALVIGESLKSIRTVVEQVAGNVIAAEILTHLPKVLKTLGL